MSALNEALEIVGEALESEDPDERERLIAEALNKLDEEEDGYPENV